MKQVLFSLIGCSLLLAAAGCECCSACGRCGFKRLGCSPCQSMQYQPQFQPMAPGSGAYLAPSTTTGAYISPVPATASPTPTLGQPVSTTALMPLESLPTY